MCTGYSGLHEGEKRPWLVAHNKLLSIAVAVAALTQIANEISAQTDQILGIGRIARQVGQLTGIPGQIEKLLTPRLADPPRSSDWTGCP